MYKFLPISAFVTASFIATAFPLASVAQNTAFPQDPAFAADYAEVGEVRFLVRDGDYDAARAQIEPLARAGNAVAQNLLGVIIEDTTSVGVSMVPALKMYQRAASQGYGKAYYNIGLLHLNGAVGIPENEQAAIDAFSGGADVAYMPAHEDLVWHLMWGGDDVLDFSRAYELALSGVAAHPNSVRLMTLLGDAFYYGLGTQEDLVASLEQYELAAENGYSYGQFSAGYQHFVGDGTPENDTLSREYFEQAAAQDYAAAFGYLAQIHFLGYGVTPDYDIAYGYAVQGDGRDGGRAAFFVGDAHRYGQGAASDLTAARAAYVRAHAAGYTYGLQRLGDLAYFGEGEPVDLEKAFGIFEQVLDENPDEEDAAYSMGYMLMRGEGTAVNLSEAVHYIEQAVTLGHWNAMGEAILLYGGSNYDGAHADRVLTAAHCLNATVKGYLAEQVRRGRINTICADTIRDLSNDERAQAKAVAQTYR